MSSIRTVGLLIVMLAFVSGCSTLRSGGAPEPSFDIDADLERLSKEFESATNITNYYGTPQAQRKDARNRFVTGRLVQIDLRYLQFIRALTTDKQQLDSATDVLNMALNLAGTVVGGVRSKTNLAAAATGIGGSKTIIDKDYYYEKSIEALVATMNAKRKMVLVDILRGLDASIEQYPFERAVTDLQTYYLAGTLNGALQFIQNEAVKSEADSSKALRAIYRLPVPTGAEVDLLERLTDAIGAQDLTQAKAAAALKALGIADGEVPAQLDDTGGAPGAKRKLQEEVRKAARIVDDGARAAALKKLEDAFRKAGMLK